jgi:hypothetical protein
MQSDKWAVLMMWYSKNAKNLPKDVSNAIDTLLDERRSEDDGEEEEA